MKSGLIPERRDIRTFNHEVQFGAVDLAQLPKEGLGRKPLSIKDQAWTQFCTAYATATASEYIEKIEMSPEFQAAVISEITGHNIANTGAPVSAALKALRRYGSLPQKDAPLTLEKDGDKVGDLTSWPQALKQIADDYLKASTYDVMGGSYDIFDNIRVALYVAKQQGEDRVAMAFTRWYPRADNQIFRKATGDYFWHAHLFIDWIMKDGELVLVQQNSYGKKWGKGGLSYWSREAVNQLAEDNRNQVHMARDLTPETAKEAQWGLGLDIYDMLVRIDPSGALKWLIEFIAGWLKDWKDPPAPTPPSPPVVPPPAPKPPEPTPPPAYDWSTPLKAKHSVRVICDEEKLTLEQKNTLCATLGCESGWKNSAINYNKGANGKVLSTDFGICQINDYWHIGPGKTFPSVQYVKDNPDKVVRWMCKMWKQNQRHLWVCYSKGMYKKYL